MALVTLPSKKKHWVFQEVALVSQRIILFPESGLNLLDINSHTFTEVLLFRSDVKIIIDT